MAVHPILQKLKEITSFSKETLRRVIRASLKYNRSNPTSQPSQLQPIL